MPRNRPEKEGRPWRRGARRRLREKREKIGPAAHRQLEGAAAIRTGISGGRVPDVPPCGSVQPRGNCAPAAPQRPSSPASKRGSTSWSSSITFPRLRRSFGRRCGSGACRSGQAAQGQAEHSTHASPTGADSSGASPSSTARRAHRRLDGGSGGPRRLLPGRGRLSRRRHASTPSRRHRTPRRRRPPSRWMLGARPPPQTLGAALPTNRVQFDFALAGTVIFVNS